MKFDREHFRVFCSQLEIPSKEGGEDESGGRVQLVPLVEIPTQTFFLDQLEIAFGKNIRFVVVEKCRQSGLTTIGLALDLYWCFMIPGLIHNFIGDVALTTSLNRSLAREFVASMQKSPQWRYEIKEDNDEFMTFSNKSKIIWHVANKRKKGGLGKSIGAAAAHGSEVADWEDEEGANSFMSSMAENNPDSLFLFESKPGGRGIWKRMCKEAGGAGNTTEMLIFVGWWLHPWYRSNLDIPAHKQRHAVYWESQPVLSREESVWVDGVKKRYGTDITPEQMSWWRWHLKQRKGDDIDSMYMHYPPLPEYGWRFGQKSFFNVNRLIERETIIQETREQRKQFFRFNFGEGRQFSDSSWTEVDPRRSFYDLIVWEPPHPPIDGYRTVIAADPIHGAEAQSNDAAVQVGICYTDCLLQAAEFVRNGIPAYQLAWVILHLAGWYLGRPKFITELQGGGYEVQNEIRRLQLGQAHGYDPVLEKAFQGLEHYIWTRPDARKGVSGMSLHYKTTDDTKQIMLEAFSHYFERQIFIVNSPMLLKEMGEVAWTNDGDLDVPRPNDRLMAASLATMGYKQVLDTDIGGARDMQGALKFTRAWFVKHIRESTGQTQAQFMTNMLTNWRDHRTLEHKSEIEQQIAANWRREKWNDIAPGAHRR